jgi:hypothetical protein
LRAHAQPHGKLKDDGQRIALGLDDDVGATAIANNLGTGPHLHDLRKPALDLSDIVRQPCT